MDYVALIDRVCSTLAAHGYSVVELKVSEGGVDVSLSPRTEVDLSPAERKAMKEDNKDSYGQKALDLVRLR